MERESFVFYQSFRNATKTLPKDNQKNALVMIVEYGIDGRLPDPETDGIAYAMFLMSKPQIDKNNQRFIAGNNGGRPPKTKPKPKDNQTITKHKPNVNVNDNVNVITKYNNIYTPLIENFLDKENKTIKYLLEKNNDFLNLQYAELDKLQKDGYDIKTIATILAFVKQDEFWSKQILSIKKLREKNKMGIPYIIVMMDKIKERKPKALDLSSYDLPNGN